MGESVVILNGGSSTGKTTIARQIQERADEYWLWTGVDHMQGLLPPTAFTSIEDDEPEPVADGWLIHFRDGALDRLPVIGPAGLAILDGMYRAAAALAAAGNNVVVDDVMYDPRLPQLAANALRACPTWLVGVSCSLAVAREREAARGDRARGGATVFHDAFNQLPRYDLVVHSDRQSAAECAEEILNMVKTTTPTALGLVD